MKRKGVRSIYIIYCITKNNNNAIYDGKDAAGKDALLQALIQEDDCLQTTSL